MIAVQSKGLFNWTRKLVDNESTFLRTDSINLLRDGCFQFSYAVGVTLIDVVLEKLPEKLISRVPVKWLRCPFFSFCFATAEMPLKLFKGPCHGNSVGGARSCWNHYFSSSSSSHSSSCLQNCSSTWMQGYLVITIIIFEKNCQIVLCFEIVTHAMYFFECRWRPTTLWGFSLLTNIQFLDLTWSLKGNKLNPKPDIIKNIHIIIDDFSRKPQAHERINLRVVMCLSFFARVTVWFRSNRKNVSQNAPIQR